MHNDCLRNEASRGSNWVAQRCKHVRNGSTKYLGTLKKGSKDKGISLKSFIKENPMTIKLPKC